ncbi:hypothetical protein [Agromyces sp. NPDC058126]|uniref:hypothetical protein n=1 Tax=Agromyces sp. NPDC058126 TaxID=3346350 RepID=UPI0036DDDF12
MLHLDDPDEGLSPVTSHARFTELAPPEFFDEGDDFAPFGSDDGHDTLRGLEDFYREHGPNADAADFLTALLREWEFDVPHDISDARAEHLVAWLAEDEMNEVFLTSESRARVAAALGELKITGAVSPALGDEARRGLRALEIMASDTTRYPHWPHRPDALRALAEIERVLAAATGSGVEDSAWASS